MTKLGVGIIGCGNISSAYLRLAPMFRDIEVRGVADINLQAAEAQGAAFGVTAYDVNGLLGADDIDIVVNLTIPAAHFEVTRQILQAGKHAYSEKPLVLTLEEGEELRALAAEKGLRVGSAPDTFLGGTHQQARAMIDDGGVGRVVAGTCHVMSHGIEMWHPNPDFFFQPGAGPMLDIGPYYVTNLIQLLGPVKRVAALASAATPTRTITSEPRNGEVIPVDTPTNIHALLEFEQGATITLSTSWDVWAHRHANMELYGTEGSLFVPDPNFFGGDLEVAGTDGEIRGVEAWDHPFGRVNEDRGTANYRTAGLADMAQGILQGRAHRCSLELAIHAVDVMTSVLRSGEEGAFVNLSTTCERPEALGPGAAANLLA
ncbi:putative oxidoreductase protein [Candidatus Rhodobacter oscarellae]|uniref:Putative oxidoreductase protein n=1 Tax=Candidatus Rhodobacter oscarellae TaxID=1675527 RepID=A0A0J9H3N9_9RHOB|nr:Gfo/Idh/MocA family oxidoreductase [Candidatus Rhodobacter lobularis]KMW60293.1 putative oxidoreductase protein [Candidatus Rhodobacter lobularis]